MPFSLIPISRCPSDEPQWAWSGRIPYGALTIIEGDPGNNKSSMIVDLAARITTGRPCYGDRSEAKPPGGVIYFAAEDDAGTLRRNLQAAGGDVDRLLVPQDSPGTTSRVVLPDDASAIEESVRQLGAKLVVFDPITSFLVGSPNSESAVRKALDPLAQIARRTGAAVVLVRHLTKASSGSALYRGVGSIALVGVVRSCFRVAIDPTDPTRRILVRVKSNGVGHVPTLVFQPVSKDGGLTIKWCGESNLSAEQVFSSGGAYDNPRL